MITLEQIIEVACIGTTVDPSLVRQVQKTRADNVVLVRHYVCYVLHKRVGLICEKIAELMGYKEHSSVLHATESIEYRIRYDIKSKNYLRTKEHEFDRIFSNQVSIAEFMPKRVIYIAGKVSGLDYKETIAKFRKAQEYLESEYYFVHNPMEIVGKGVPYEEAMRMCLQKLVFSQEIYMLEDYQQSAGALLELQVAKSIGITIRYESEAFEQLQEAV